MAKEFRDQTVRVTVEIYEELQQLWMSDVAGALHAKSDHLTLDHSSLEFMKLVSVASGRKYISYFYQPFICFCNTTLFRYLFCRNSTNSGNSSFSLSSAIAFG